MGSAGHGCGCEEMITSKSLEMRMISPSSESANPVDFELVDSVR